MIDVVLATDLSVSFDVIGRFNTFVGEVNVPVEPKLASAPSALIRAFTRGASKTIALTNRDWARTTAGAAVLSQIIIKVCDIGHAAKPLQQHIVWSQLVAEEFHKQVQLGGDDKTSGFWLL